MFRDFQPGDRDAFLSMCADFYATGAVVHDVDPKNFENTFEAAIARSPYMRGMMIEDAGEIAGYALLSFTHSNEVGGMVVLIEELYLKDACRGKGCGRAFFEFAEREYPSARRFRLEVTRENADAVRLYTRLGYETLDYDQMVKDI